MRSADKAVSKPSGFFTECFRNGAPRFGGKVEAKEEVEVRRVSRVPRELETIRMLEGPNVDRQSFHAFYNPTRVLEASTTYISSISHRNQHTANPGNIIESYGAVSVLSLSITTARIPNSFHAAKRRWVMFGTVICGIMRRGWNGKRRDMRSAGRFSDWTIWRP